MTIESKTWRLAKLTSARDEAVKRLKLAVMRAAWKDAVMYAQQAVDAEEEIVKVDREIAREARTSSAVP